MASTGWAELTGKETPATSSLLKWEDGHEKKMFVDRLKRKSGGNGFQFPVRWKKAP